MTAAVIGLIITTMVSIAAWLGYEIKYAATCMCGRDCGGECTLPRKWNDVPDEIPDWMEEENNDE